MAKKITWRAPEDTDVISVEISRSSTIYGTYSVIDTINATSDGNSKSSSNSWVTTYTDINGTKTDWYKIRFYNGSYYSDYSDPISTEELVRLCTVSEVKKALDTTGRWTDDEVWNAIDEVEELIYLEFGKPIQAMWTEVGKINSTIQTRYYVGEENIYRIDRLFYGTTTMHELYLEDGYKVNTNNGMIEVLPVASSGVTLDTTYLIEAHYVPGVFNKLAIYRTVLYLLEQQDSISGGKTSKEVIVARNKLKMVEAIISNKYCLATSS